MFEHLNFRVNHHHADYSDAVFPKEDQRILRDLGKQVAKIAARPIMKEKQKLWMKHNSLEGTRPVILADPENGWNEIIRPEDIECQNSIARIWECQLRKHIFWGDEMNDDFVVEPYFNLPCVYTERPWRVAGAEGRQTEKKAREDGGSYRIETVLKDYSQLQSIVKPSLEIDYGTTSILLDKSREIFADVLEVRLHTVWFWSVGLTDDLLFLRGLERLMYDFYDEPEGVHRLMELLLQGAMERLDLLEERSLLCLNNDGSFVGSGGMGFTRELPRVDFDGLVTTKDLWGLGESQATVGLSPEMFKEFIFPYQKSLLERFGLVCYGCCEPMDDRFDIVKEAANLRRVSVSPWSNKELMAEKLGKDYICSMKANPANLAAPALNEEAVREEFKIIKRVAPNTCLEVIMKDNHTIGGNPENVKRWVQIAREELGL